MMTPSILLGGADKWDKMRQLIQNWIFDEEDIVRELMPFWREESEAQWACWVKASAKTKHRCALPEDYYDDEAWARGFQLINENYTDGLLLILQWWILSALLHRLALGSNWLKYQLSAVEAFETKEASWRKERDDKQHHNGGLCWTREDQMADLRNYGKEKLK